LRREVRTEPEIGKVEIVCDQREDSCVETAGQTASNRNRAMHTPTRTHESVSPDAVCAPSRRDAGGVS
jgi:hypothetical protein